MLNEILGLTVACTAAAVVDFISLIDSLVDDGGGGWLVEETTLVDSSGAAAVVSCWATEAAVVDSSGWTKALIFDAPVPISLIIPPAMPPPPSPNRPRRLCLRDCPPLRAFSLLLCLIDAILCNVRPLPGWYPLPL
jgi:hypothetical protein